MCIMRHLNSDVPQYIFDCIMLNYTCILPVYCILYTPYIFHESNFLRIGTSRHFRKWLNSRSRRRAIMDGGRRNQYHSLICTCTVYCTTSIVYNVYTSCILASGSEVNLFSRVIEFANSTRLAKFAKIKPPRNIWRRYVQVYGAPTSLYCKLHTHACTIIGLHIILWTRI